MRQGIQFKFRGSIFSRNLGSSTLCVLRGCKLQCLFRYPRALGTVCMVVTEDDSRIACVVVPVLMRRTAGGYCSSIVFIPRQYLHWKAISMKFCNTESLSGKLCFEMDVDNLSLTAIELYLIIKVYLRV